MKRQRGFTLIEALVSILILSVVMIVALTLLVSMRSFAAKQQTFTAPRQSARAAVDYLSFFLAGATDLNVEIGNPNALVMWTTFGHEGAVGPARQASYNNLTAAEAGLGYGDEGTDIISLAIPTNPVRITVDDQWDPSTNDLDLNYTAGCPDDVENMRLFKQATGAMLSGATEVSALLTVQDLEGRWRYLQITSYVSSTCSAAAGTNPTNRVIQIQIADSSADQINPPGGWRTLATPPSLYTINAGIEYTSFRVRNGNLEQKTSGVDGAGAYSPGIFDADCDRGTPAGGCPNRGFTPVVENIEDLQIAYVFRDGKIWNTGSQVLATVSPDAPPVASNIPEQVQSLSATAPGDFDVTNVRALRVSVIARSNPLDIGARQLSAVPPTPPPVGTPNPSTQREGIYRRPALEDHAAGSLDTVATGVFDRYRLTTTLGLRNRMLGW